MGFPIRILLVEPESQSLIFLITNLVVFIFILCFVVSWPFTLIYLIIHFTVFFVVSKRLSAGRFYASKKDLHNQTVIVTGAAAGIGRVTAIELAKLRARVIVGIRGQQRAERVAEELSRASNRNVVGYHLDLSDLASVKAFAEKIDKVDILINNAGVVKLREERTKDGLESTFGTNHIGHFYLAELLLPLLIQSRGRLVNVSSVMHIFASEKIDFSKNKSYNHITAYAESKLANIMHAFELQRRYGDQGIKAYSLHPGFILSTELSRDQTPIQGVLMSPFGIASKTIAQGAMTTLYCALSDEAQPGKYHSNCQVAQPKPVAYDSEKAKELWTLSEKIVNEKSKHL